MSYCPNCGRKILEESLGCPVCNVRGNIDPTRAVPQKEKGTEETKEETKEERKEEGKEEVKEEAKEEVKEAMKAETVDSFTVEDADGEKHRFENNGETGDAEYRGRSKSAEDATIPAAIKALVIILIIAVGGLGAIAGCVAGVALSRHPSEDYRRFGKLMLTVSVVMLAISFLCCCLLGTGGAALPYEI